MLIDLTSVKLNAVDIFKKQKTLFFFFYLSAVTIKYREYGRVALVGDVGQHLEAILHMISPPLDGINGDVVVFELPGFGELRIQNAEASQPLVLHHLRHLSLHHLHGIPARFDDGFHLVGMEEVTPQRQTDAEQKQRLRPEEKIAHDPTQKRQERHCVSYHHTQPSCSLTPSLLLASLHPPAGTREKSITGETDFSPLKCFPSLLYPGLPFHL